MTGTSGAAAGFAAIAVAVFCFGSNFIPLKRIRIGDGVFFQFIMCIAIFMTSIPVYILLEFPKFHGMAMLGGFLWCTGNMLCPIAIRFVGLGLGLLVWGSVSMICGWASGTFGLFGLKRQDIKDPTLNYVGVAIAFVGLLIFLQVKTEDTSLDSIHNNQSRHEDNDDSTEGGGPSVGASRNNGDIKSPLLKGGVTTASMDGSPYSSNLNTTGESLSRQNSREGRLMSHYSDIDSDVYRDYSVNSTTSKRSKVSLVSKWSPSHWSETNRRIFGLVLACIAGVFFGTSFDPAQYIIDNTYDGDDNSMNYIFPHYCGILLTSWFYTIVYFLYNHVHEDEPFLNPECILPATICGIAWGIAEIAFFIANGALGFTISFPIISCGPGFVGALWGVFLFKEITGPNIKVLIAAILVTLPALVMVGLSH